MSFPLRSTFKLTLWNVFRRRKVADLRVGQVVEVRSAAEILATLDHNGELDCLPFMPEMLQFCGKRLTVHKVAHKLCDTISATGMRWMTSAVHLTGSRCDGSAHGGCQTACSLYWKEAWLKPVTGEQPKAQEPFQGVDGAKLEVLERSVRRTPATQGDERYFCQATELLRAAPERMGFLDLRQYIIDVRSGNAGLLTTLRTLFFGLFNRFQSKSRRLLPETLRFKGGMHWGWVQGTVVGRTPTTKLDLQAGELVRIKSKEEIEKTIDTKRLNRGMGFEEEMAWHCGTSARVARRVERCIDEKTGRMLSMQNPCIVLEGIVCEGIYSANCPREFLPFWREIWLDRVDEGNAAD
jgi:hypothetical protein